MKEPVSPTVLLGAARLSTAGFARMVERADPEANLGFKPVLICRGTTCGYALANRGHDTRALASLPWSQEHPAHRALHGTIADPVQGFLAVIKLTRLLRGALGSFRATFFITCLAVLEMEDMKLEKILLGVSRGA